MKSCFIKPIIHGSMCVFNNVSIKVMCQRNKKQESSVIPASLSVTVCFVIYSLNSEKFAVTGCPVSNTTTLPDTLYIFIDYSIDKNSYINTATYTSIFTKLRFPNQST